jgi:hypothetical protein
MKILNIGDLHGKNILKYINPDKYDKIIFVGDYMDSYDIPPMEQIKVLKDIIQFKIDNIDKVELLIGNHDIQYYLPDSKIHLVRASGYNSMIKLEVHNIFMEHKELFKIAYQHKNYIWTHAGIHRGWYNDYFKKFDTKETLADSLNKEFEFENPVLWYCSYIRGGYKKVGGILWADKIETWKKPLKNYHQIVGHTRVDNVVNHNIDENTSVTYIDCLDKNKLNFYVLNLDN